MRRQGRTRQTADDVEAAVDESESQQTAIVQPHHIRQERKHLAEAETDVDLIDPDYDGDPASRGDESIWKTLLTEKATR